MQSTIITSVYLQYSFFYISYGFKKKIVNIFKILNFFHWHLFMNLIDTCIGILVKKKFSQKCINLNAQEYLISSDLIESPLLLNMR